MRTFFQNRFERRRQRRQPWRPLSWSAPTGRRLALAACLSLAAHAAAVPALRHVRFTLATATAPPPLEAQMAPEPEPPPRPHRQPRIVEPPPEPLRVATAPTPVDEPPPRVHYDFQRPHVEPVEFDLPHPVLPPRRHGPAAVASNRPARRVEPAPAPAPTPEAPVAPAPTAPVAPVFPDSPPRSLLEGLPRAGIVAGQSKTLLDKEKQETLRRKVYEQTYYPEAAAELEVEGVVVVGFRLDGTGRPLDIEVEDARSVHPSLRREAVRMIERGSPYPIPTIRQPVSAFVAVAYLNTPESRGERLQIVLSSGDDQLDRRAREIASQDAAADDRVGWQIVAYGLSAQFDVSPGPQVSSARLVQFEGDRRFKRFVVENAHRFVAPVEHSGRVKIPIQFRILDP